MTPVESLSHYRMQQCYDQPEAIRRMKDRFISASKKRLCVSWPGVAPPDPRMRYHVGRVDRRLWWLRYSPYRVVGDAAAAGASEAQPPGAS